MVNANLLDAVSAFFRMNREADAATGKRRVFGGMSVILIGDLFQLPPVVGDRERPWFEQYYDSTQFYGAKSLRYGDKTEKTVPSYYAIELKKTFRQADQEFVDLLTNVREGHQLSETVAALNRLCSITQHPPKGAVWLSPRNVEVDTTNQRELSNLPGEESLFEGELDGTFKEDRLPSPLMLRLKEGAQVMFTQNDKDKRWVNGTLRTVEELYEDGIVVKLSESRLEVDLNRAKWEDYRYEWRPETKRIERIPTGSYKQFPLMLAWAMTIHKSQGKTIDKVHLDLGGGAFASGQTYVALSRCRSITGLSMSRPLALTDIRVDDHARSFYATLRALIEAVPPASMLAELDRMEAARKGGDELPF